MGSEGAPFGHAATRTAEEVNGYLADFHHDWKSWQKCALVTLRGVNLTFGWELQRLLRWSPRWRGEEANARMAATVLVAVYMAAPVSADASKIVWSWCCCARGCCARC